VLQVMLTYVFGLSWNARLLGIAVRFVFADEAGCFTFKRQKGASNYFLLCTIATDDCSLSNDLLTIRRNLAAANEPDRDKLHATSDSQVVRDQVFEALAAHEFRVDATILEKCKAQPQTRTSDAVFYRYAWWYHFKHVGPALLKDADKLFITAAALGTNKTRAAFKNALNNAIQQICLAKNGNVRFWIPRKSRSCGRRTIARGRSKESGSLMMFGHIL
jgi:hypothetical protein